MNAGVGLRAEGDVPEGYSSAQGSQRLDGHIAIVTGAGSRPDVSFPRVGVGAACALNLASMGAKVALVDISAEAIERTMSWAGDNAANLLPIVADVREEVDCERAMKSVVDEFGALTTLVNNVGIVGTPGTVVETSLDTWRSVIDINLTSVLLMSKYAVPRMIASGGGSITNISSIGAIRGFGSTGYAASKGGMLSLGTSMAFAHGRDGIRVNTVLPGHVSTPMGTAGTAEAELVRQRSSMLGTEGTAWDVARAVAFLSSDAARWITAAALPVDGGASMATGSAMYNHMNSGQEQL